MRLELQVDAAEFWPSLERDIAGARRHVYVQALSFEGDTAGQGLARALASSPAPDRRVVVDHYTRWDLADKFLYYPPHLFDGSLRALARRTRRMFEEMRATGVAVRFTNPVGLLLHRFPLRNHKKLALVDDRVAYLGGINFADHNFHWRDMMLRIEDPGVAAFLKEDFLTTWARGNRSIARRFGGIELHVLDGRENGASFERVFDLIDGARERIYVESPAVTEPFVSRLRRARARGVQVTVVTPEVNNWGVIKQYMTWLAAASDLDVRFYRGRLTHLKAMLVDDRCLVMGSANLDLWSYDFQQEYLVLVTESAIIEAFTRRVLGEGMKSTIAADGARLGLRERMAPFHLRWLGLMAHLVTGRWPGRPSGARRIPVEAGLAPQPVAEQQHEAGRNDGRPPRADAQLSE